MARAAKFCSLLLWAWVLGPTMAIGQSVDTGLYEATVALPADTERGRTEAFAEAMRMVLVRATGRERAFEEPGLAPLVENAARYVQRYRRLDNNALLVEFDGRRIERLIAAADPTAVSEVLLTVSGIDALDAYAQVTGYLEGLVLTRRLEVTELDGDSVTYRVRIRGDAQRLAEALAANTNLTPRADAAMPQGSSLHYRYTP